MNNGIYSASAGFLARSQELDVAANNLANANTTAYRVERTGFHTQLMSATKTMASDAVSAFSLLDQPRIDFTQGSFLSTGSPLDFALEGQGFFAVQSPNGIVYTRDGAFHVDALGQLVTVQGYPVLGTRGKIRLPGGASPEISEWGVVSVNGEIAEQLHLVQFDDETQLTPLGKGYYSGPTAAAKNAKGLGVRQGYLENANASPMELAGQVMGIARNAEMLQRALSTLNDDFNKVATQDLPKV